MNNDNQPPQPDPGGNRPPPRPPKSTALGLGPDDEDGDHSSPKIRPQKETVTIRIGMVRSEDTIVVIPPDSPSAEH